MGKGGFLSRFFGIRVFAHGDGWRSLTYVLSPNGDGGGPAFVFPVFLPWPFRRWRMECATSRRILSLVDFLFPASNISCLTSPAHFIVFGHHHIAHHGRISRYSLFQTRQQLSLLSIVLLYLKKILRQFIHLARAAGSPSGPGPCFLQSACALQPTLPPRRMSADPPIRLPLPHPVRPSLT